MCIILKKKKAKFRGGGTTMISLKKGWLLLEYYLAPYTDTQFAPTHSQAWTSPFFSFFFSLTSCVLSRWLCHVLHTRDRLIYWFWMLDVIIKGSIYRSVSSMYLDFPLHWSSDKVLIFLNKLNNEMSLFFFFLSIVETVSADLTFFYF